MQARQRRDMEEVEDVRSVYFTVHMSTKGMLDYLEIPAAFTRKTGWPRQGDCAFVAGIPVLREWPVQFLIGEDGSGNRRAKSAGHGWSNFLVDTEVKPGSLLIFEVVDERCCMVTVYHLTSPRKPVVSGQGGPLHRPSDGPVFRKTLQASHLKPGSAARLDFPTKYWRQFGPEHFHGTNFILCGPSSAVRVKSATLVTTKQTFCYLQKGWYDFVALNDFKLGDTLEFAAVGRVEFNVSRC